MKHTSAFSLIEILIFVSILSLFFIIAAIITTSSIRNMKVNEHKILATRYAEELMEWIKNEKEYDWGGAKFTVSANTFTENITNCTTPGSCIFCFDQSSISGWPTADLCNGYNLSSFYKRQVTFTVPADIDIDNDYIYQVNVKVEVIWSEFGVDYKVPVTDVFSVWE